MIRPFLSVVLVLTFVPASGWAKLPPEVAEKALTTLERGVKSGDFTARAKVIPSIQPHQVHMFHGWEPYHFKDGKSHQFLAPSPLRVTQLVGDYAQLHWRMTYWDAGQFDRGTRVDVRKA